MMKEVIMECSKRYNFDGEDAIRELLYGGGEVAMKSAPKRKEKKAKMSEEEKEAKKAALKEEKEARCSFCGIPQSRAMKLIAGPGVYICDECTKTAYNLIFSGNEACASTGDRWFRLAAAN